MSLKIYVLGQFSLEAGDRPIELPSRPAQSLLAYLALNAGLAHRRERLAGLLWPDATDANARSYLRQALWRIRKSFGEASLPWRAYLQISDLAVTFDDRADYWLDAHVLLNTDANGSPDELSNAVRLYRGELLPGFYDEWVLAERDRVQATYNQQMTRMLDCLLQKGCWHEALTWGEQWIRLGHAPEPAYRALLRAFAGLGQPGMLATTYQRCVEALDRELGVPPSKETQQLFEQLQREELPTAPAVPAPVPQPDERGPQFLDTLEAAVQPPLFVARERELAGLDNFLQLALAGKGRVSFVTGEAGSGKTALIQEFILRAQTEHADLIVAGGNCNAHTGIGDPYLPFREILELLTADVEAQVAAGTICREHARRLWHALPVVAEVLLDVGPDLIDTFVPGANLLERAAVQVPAGTGWLVRLQDFIARKARDTAFHYPQQGDLFEQYTRVLQELAQHFPLVLVVDDLQWADLGSISLLFHLGRRLAGCRILLVGAYRPEEVMLAGEEEQHPLQPVLNEFQRQYADVAINLDEAEGRAFVEQILDSEPNQLAGPFREMLYRQTRGHPLFTLELLRGMQERGDLVQDADGRWVESPSLDWEMMPARVEAVIAQRIGRLAQPLRAALRVASVEGEQFTAEVVAKVCQTDASALLGHLSRELDRKHRLVRAQSIVRVDGQLLSRYRFLHILIQKYLYSSLDEVERVHLHDQVGNVLAELYGEKEQSLAVIVQLARHFQEARSTEKAIRYLQLAGEKALVLCAYREAVAHETAALELLRTLPDSPERAQQELPIQLALGVAWMSLGLPAPEMEAAYARARDLCTMLGKTDQLSRALSGLTILNYVRANYRLALASGMDTLRYGRRAQDQLLELVGHWQLGFTLFALGEYREALEHIAQVTTSYNAEAHHQAFIRLRGVDIGPSAMAYEACCLWCLGYPDQAMKRREEALTLARQFEHAFTLADVVCYAGCMLDSMRRDAPNLQITAQELTRLANEQGLPGWSNMGTCLIGEALTLSGQLEKGISLLETGIKTKLSTGERINLSGKMGVLAEAHLWNKQPELAEAQLVEAFSQLEKSDERHYEVELYRIKAELLLVQGDEEAAQASLEHGLAVARRREAKGWELRTAVSLARLWQKQGRIEEARGMLAPLYDWFTEGFQTPDMLEARTLLEELA